MNTAICILVYILCIVQMVIIVTVAQNISSKKNLGKKEENDNVFGDDEDLEGSGTGENRYDLESSGSGFGPDDEDTERILGPGGIDKKPEAKIPITSSLPTTKTTTVPSTSTPVTVRRPEVVTDPHIVEPINTKDYHSKDDFGTIGTEKPIDGGHLDNSGTVYKDRTISFFAQPGILAGYFIFPAIVGGAVVGLLCAILVVMFIVYRMRKKDEGSYALEELKRCPPTNPYLKPNHREFFA